MNEKRKRHGLRLTLLGAAIGLVGSLADVVNTVGLSGGVVLSSYWILRFA